MIQCIFWLAAGLLLHTYVLYPLFVGFVRRSQRPENSGELPSISVIVPAHNEAAVLEAKIENVRQLDYPADRIELLIFDDGSSDETAQIAEAHAGERVRFFRGETRSGKANAVNRLVDEAAHKMLLLTDANVSMNPDSVSQMVRHLSDPAVGAVTGEVRLVGSDKEFRSGEMLYYRLERRIQNAESSVGSVMGVDGAMYVMRRELFGTLPSDTILDDFLISMNILRAGKRIVYEPMATAVETGTPSARQEFNRRIRIAAGAVQLLKRGNVPRWNDPSIWFQFLSHKVLRWTSPAMIALMLASSAALATTHWFYSVILMTEVILLAIAVILVVKPSLRSTNLGGVIFFFALSQVAIAIGLFKGVFNRQPPQWEKGQRVKHTKILDGQ
ncbi:Poly-beta-1,6-N-acetyl-D-glucosamine synthase [Rubripirellula tenax]|uniref:Poly-beta-1,6-N-acetyl-D-glucosamine synthase n=1 Tax=Rubripirellula tenax TaxID=2528015 RepID=A0A5C6F2B0_9BACT|nr:glycosyltransferase family 2 protein [Rubripirellula tenax]TWU54497.1 Poly-beta-1,6-N-acetyl-D-glucosamine synthase [Rubripirellula tenax]